MFTEPGEGLQPENTYTTTEECALKPNNKGTKELIVILTAYPNVTRNPIFSGTMVAP